MNNTIKNTLADKEKRKNKWISITGYRTLLFLKLLSEKSFSIDELADILKADKVTSKSTSKDTIRLTINTLKLAGCQFNRPKKTNNYKYLILKHPFHWNISDEEASHLILLRDRFCNSITPEEVVILNEVYEKLISLSANNDYIQKVYESKPLNNLNIDLWKELSKPGIKGKKINITYFSPKYGNESLDVIPHRVSYENSKVYLWCYIFKYEKISILNVERILKINSVSMEQESKVENCYEVEYKLTGNSLLSYKPENYEEIIEQANDYITVKAKVSNEFWFIQRLLLFGSDFKIISPDTFREKLIQKIKQIRKWYENDETR